MHDVINTVADSGSVFTIQPMSGSHYYVLCKIKRKTIAIVANQPQHMAGSITVEADKATSYSSR